MTAAHAHPPPPGDEPFRRLTDPQWFSLSWYGQPIDVLCRRKGLEVVRPERGLPQAIASLPAARTGHLVAITPGLRASDAPGAGGVVVGGPCMGDCGPFPTLEALYDAVQPMLAGKALGLPVVLYLGDQEEIIERGGTGRWLELALRFETWLLALAEGLGVEGVHVVRTSLPAHGAALQASNALLAAVEPSSVDSAFHLSVSAAPPTTENGRISTTRVVQAHLPSVVAAHLGRETSEVRVVVAENLQQAGAIGLARTIAAASGAPPVELVAHWPAPGLSSATERMFRSGAWDKIPAWDLEEVAVGDVSGMHPYTCEFFATWLDEAERKQLVEATRRAFGRA